MTIEEIERLIRRLDRSDITALTVGDGTSSLTLRLSPSPVRTASPQPDETAESGDAGAAPALRSPSIGRLRLRHPEAAPGDDAPVPRPVRAGDIVAFLECGPVLRPVVADRDGTLGAPLQADGALVGFGTPLFPWTRAARYPADVAEGQRHAG